MDYREAADAFARVTALRLVIDAVEAITVDNETIAPVATLWAKANGTKGGRRSADRLIVSTLAEVAASLDRMMAEAVLAATLIDSQTLVRHHLLAITDTLWAETDQLRADVVVAIATEARRTPAYEEPVHAPSDRRDCPECGKAISLTSIARHRRKMHGVTAPMPRRVLSNP